jgi:hypothetical protein
VSRFPLHVIGWVLYLVAFVWTLYELRRQRWRTLWFVALWLAHNVVFYTFVLAREIALGVSSGTPPEYVVWWANVVRLHGGFAILSILYGVWNSFRDG